MLIAKEQKQKYPKNIDYQYKNRAGLSFNVRKR